MFSVSMGASIEHTHKFYGNWKTFFSFFTFLFSLNELDVCSKMWIFSKWHGIVVRSFVRFFCVFHSKPSSRLIKFNCLHLCMTCRWLRLSLSRSLCLSAALWKQSWFSAFRWSVCVCLCVCIWNVCATFVCSRSSHLLVSVILMRSMCCFGRQHNLTNPQIYPLFYQATNTNTSALSLQLWSRYTM